MPNYYGYQQPMQMYQQTQANGIISVPNEEIVKTYPVAPGNCVMFKIEGKPIVMEKSMGFSQFEPPKIEKYKLVKESVSQPQNEAFTPQSNNSIIEDLKSEIRGLWAEIDHIKKTTDKQRGIKDDSEHKRNHERSGSVEK